MQSGSKQHLFRKGNPYWTSKNRTGMSLLSLSSDHLSYSHCDHGPPHPRVYFPGLAIHFQLFPESSHTVGTAMPLLTDSLGLSSAWWGWACLLPVFSDCRKTDSIPNQQESIYPVSISQFSNQCYQNSVFYLLTGRTEHKHLYYQSRTVKQASHR